MSASISSSQLKYLDRLADYPSSGKDYLFEIPISSHRIPKCIDEYPIEVANFALKEFETGSQRPVMGSISDASLLVWKWEATADSDFVCLFILGDDYVMVDPYWAQYYPFLKLNRLSGQLDLGFSINQIPVYSIDHEVVFVGGHQTYGHWIADNFPLALHIVQNLDKREIPLLTFNARSWQFDIIREMLPMASLFNVDFATFPAGPVRIFVKRLWIADRINVASRYFVFHQYLSKYRVSQAISMHNKLRNQLVYFQRRNSTTSKGSRVANGFDISRTVEKLGGIVLDPAELSYRDKADMFYSPASIFLNEPGSGEFNFHLFASQDSHLVQLMPAQFLVNPTGQCLHASWRYALPNLDKITFLPGSSESIHQSVLNGYTDIAIYDTNELIEVITRLQVRLGF